MKILKILGVTTIVIVLVAGFALYKGDIPKDVVDARYSSPASQFLDLQENGLIHFRDEGNRRHPAIVLVHGSSASLHTWEPWVARLKDKYRVISLDLPAHGLTGETEAGDYGMATYIQVVDALVEHLGVDKFVLGGNSMGGSVSWRYALAHPTKLDGLVLVDSGGPREWFTQTEGEGGSAVLAFSLLRQGWFRVFAERLDPYYMTQQGVYAAYNNSPIIDDALIMRYYDLNLREGTRRATLARFAQPRTEPSAGPSDITVPTLIMWGTEDALIPFSIAKRFEEEIPNTTTAYYENVGHIPMEEVADASADDLLNFLAEVYQPVGGESTGE